MSDPPPNPRQDNIVHQFDGGPIDKWIASSLMQKAIRRGEADLAECAARRLGEMDRRSLWRRLIITAVEDVGAANPELVALTTAISSRSSGKPAAEQLGAAISLARLLAGSVKDRSADYLICAATSYESLRPSREALAMSSTAERLRVVRDQRPPLTVRGTAAWLASELALPAEARRNGGGLASLVALYRELGVPANLVDATEQAARSTREPITVLVPLVHLAVQASRSRTEASQPLPEAPTVYGLPLYAFDMHTRLGRRAIQRFAQENEAVQACLTRHVPTAGRSLAIFNATFHADAAPVSRQFVWDQSASLEQLAIEGDLLVAGCDPCGVQPLMAAVRGNLGHLNAIRARLWTTSLGLHT